MKTTARFIAWSMGAIFLPLASMAQQEKSAELNVFKMASIPAGQYDVNLQFEGKNHKLIMEAGGERIRTLKAAHPALEGLEGAYELIGNGVFLVRLRSRHLTASQFWLFQPDGSAIIKEIPDRGEQQKAVPIPPLGKTGPAGGASINHKAGGAGGGA